MTELETITLIICATSIGVVYFLCALYSTMACKHKYVLTNTLTNTYSGTGRIKQIVHQSDCLYCGKIKFTSRNFD